MTKTVRNSRSHEVEHLRKEVERLTAALAAIKNQKDVYFLEVRIDDGETLTTTRTCYRAKADATNDLTVAKHRFVGTDKELASIEPVKLTPGSTDLTIANGAGQVFRGSITRIKII